MRRALLALSLALTAGFAFLVGDPTQEGEDALIQRKYKDAIPHLRRALEEGKPEQRDRVLFLLARAQVLAADVEAGIATYTQIEKELPGSPLTKKARFSAAEAHAQAKRFREAAAIYRDEIEKLIGLSRKEEVAATYLGLAEQALQQERPDYPRAVSFFDLAVDLGLSPQKERSVKLIAAEAKLKANDLNDAIARFTPLTKTLTKDQGLLRALLGLGKSKRLAGDRAGARTALRDLIALDKASAAAGDAAYEIALSYGVPAPAAAELDRAVEALAVLAKEHPLHEKAKIADFLVAQCQQHLGRGDAALLALGKFLDQHGGEDLAEVPLARVLVGDVLRSQNKLSEAITAWRTYLKAHPAHGEWERVQRAIVDAEYGIAWGEYQLGLAGATSEHFAKARELFDAFSRAYPIEPRNPDILDTLGEMLAREKKFEAAKDAFARCVSKYPGTAASSHSQFRIAEIFETETFNYLEALRAYRKVTWGPWVAQAQQRVGLLEKKHLHLLTARTFRSGEAAGFKVTSRNIEKVRVRVWRLDLETYFRAKHGLGGVDRLDIEVIAPDKEFESSVKEYKQYQQTEREVEIGWKDPGAYVVKVDDKELEATALVLVTDLAVIVKSSRHELLVFAQNQKEGRVEAGTRVVLSDGGKVLAEGVTSADGCWSWKGKELQTSNSLSVFAIAPGGSGASSLDLSGLGYSPGLTARGFLFTDRPAYLPGQLVHVKGIVREVKDGTYTMPGKDGYVATIHSAGGRLLLRREIQWTEFGTFAVDLPLPVDAELGDWRITVQREPALPEAFSTTFTVAVFERPRVALAAEPKAAVVFRGERIAGRIVAKYFFGEPVVGRVVRYALLLPGGGKLESEGTTNAAGEVPFDFDTKEFGEEALAVIEATLVEENVGTRLVVPVVTTEFVPLLSVVRPIYLAGESFDVKVVLADRAGKPLAKSGTVKLLRLEAKGGSTTEVLVEQKDFTSDGKDGVGKVTFSAKKGGQHVARLEVKDRFGTLVTGQVVVEVSGEEDQIKLRLLSDRQNFKVGEVAALKVSNRVGKKLVLQTLQGDGVLAHKAYLLEGGESTLELTLAPEHAPNFAVALAMIDGDRLHVADRELLVARDLQVTVKPAVAVAKPGEEVEVEIVAKDPKGNPVKAELALALVDESVFALFPERSGTLGAHFWGRRRETSFRTTSSCTWKSEGLARLVSKEIVAEERRAEDLQRAAGAPAVGSDGAGDPRSDPRRARESGRPSGQATPGSGTAARSAAPPEGAAQVADELFSADRRMDGGGAGGQARRGVQGRVGYVANQPAKAGEPAQNLFGAFAETSTAGGADVFYLGTGQQQAGVLDLNGFGQNRGMQLPTSSPRQDFSETGAWLSALVTDGNGSVKTKLKLPESTTSFKLSVRGVTADTYVGEGAANLRTQKSLQVAILSPATLTEGDVSTLSARAHNLDDSPRNVALSLETTVRGATTKSEHSAAAKPHEELEKSFPLTATSGDDVGLILRAVAGSNADALARTVPVQPYGIELRDGRSGVTTQSELVKLSLPAGREYARLSLAIELGADPGLDLVSVALGAGYRIRSHTRTDNTVTSLASQGIGALFAWQHLEQSGVGTPLDVQRLRGFVEGLLGQIVSLQLQDGAFAWVAKQHSDPRSTAQVLTFLALAGKRGFAQASDVAVKAAEYLLKTRLEDAPSRARAALALTLAARGRFEDLNALQRARASLDTESLARLTLAWMAASRGDMANEAVAALRNKLVFSGRPDARSLEATALGIAALAAVDARDPLVANGIAFLGQQRVGVAFGTAESNAAALWAFANAGGSKVALAARSEVTLVVNGKTIATLPATAPQTQTTWFVPARDVKERDNQVEIVVQGKGTVRWSTVLTGFAKGFRPEDRRRELAEIRRYYLPALQRVDLQPVQPGFSVVTGEFQSFENTVTMVEVGKSARVRTEFWLQEAQRAAMTPLVFEEPIPAGCTVAKDSIRGTFDLVDVAPDKLTFYLREGQWSSTVEYELQARFPGTYRILPARVYGASRPDLIAYGEPAQLIVNPRGVASTDAYRMTPDELYTLGKKAFEKDDHAQADTFLAPLFAGWKLHDHVHKDVVRMLLFVAIAKKDPARIVRFFEDLKDRYQDLVIPFDKIVAVGSAYLDQGEFERALMVFRAAAEASFIKEAAVATTLERAGEVKASARFLRRLIMAYPDINTIRVSLYSLAQKEAALAASLQPGAPLDERVGRADELRKAAIAGLREFLVLYPEDQLAEEVSFAWATTLLEAKDVGGALAVAEAALGRYPGSTFEDELLYTCGYCQFALGKHEAAFATLDRVVQGTFPRQGGGRGPSENKFHAIYLQGQIHHALGQPEKALASYELVKDRFSDAGEATDYFLRKSLALPEVTSVALAEKAEIVVSYRNVEKVEIKVYRVDLMRLYLLEKSLNDIRGVELHGISPLATLQVTLGDGRDFRSKEKKVELALDKAGAYLVVARGGDLLATGMVLKSDLKIEAQEALDVGRVRVNVKRGEAFLTGAHVKVVGSGGDRAFRSGETDLRGIYVADNLVGMVTVIVKKDDEYAFFRGSGVHQPQSYAPPPPVPQLRGQRQEGKKELNFDALQKNIESNSVNRARQTQWLENEVFNKQQQGVEVFKTK